MNIVLVDLEQVSFYEGESETQIKWKLEGKNMLKDHYYAEKFQVWFWGILGTILICQVLSIISNGGAS